MFPTPVEAIMTVADVEEVKEDLLSPGLLAKIRAGAEMAGGLLKRAISKIMGLFHASAGLVYLDQSLIEVKKRFVRLAEHRSLTPEHDVDVDNHHSNGM